MLGSATQPLRSVPSARSPESSIRPFACTAPCDVRIVAVPPPQPIAASQNFTSVTSGPGQASFATASCTPTAQKVRPSICGLDRVRLAREHRPELHVRPVELRRPLARRLRVVERQRVELEIGHQLREAVLGIVVPAQRQERNARLLDDLPEAEHRFVLVVVVGRAGLVEHAGRAQLPGRKRDVHHVAEPEDQIALRVVERLRELRLHVVAALDLAVVDLLPLPRHAVGHVREQDLAGPVPGVLAVGRLLALRARARAFQRIHAAARGRRDHAPVLLVGQVLRVGHETDRDVARARRAGDEREREREREGPCHTCAQNSLAQDALRSGSLVAITPLWCKARSSASESPRSARSTSSVWRPAERARR